MDNQMKTITYSQIGSLSIQLDLYYPSTFPPPGEKVPALIFFHGGGMVAGCRQTLDFQHWLKDATLSQKILFISADHRLLHPSTGASIHSDIHTLFAFLSHPSFSTTYLPSQNPLDTTRLAISGESGGVYAALTAAAVAQPRPKVLMCQYGMGGELLSDWWIQEKNVEDVKQGVVKGPIGAAEVTRESLSQFFPRDGESELKEVSFDPMVIPVLKKPSVAAEQEGGGAVKGTKKTPDVTREANPKPPPQRRNLLALFWREGTLLDHILDLPGLSTSLRQLPPSERLSHIPPHLLPLLPQHLLSSSSATDFPPTVFLHGTRDVIVDITESERPYEVLKGRGVRTEMVRVKGGGHALLDPSNMPHLVEGAEGGRERAWGFLLEELRR